MTDLDRAPNWGSHKMRTAILSLLISSALLLAGTPISRADTFDDALEAYGQGDYEKAERLALPLALDGDAGAQFIVGISIFIANGGQADSEALRWIELAAENGFALAQFQLGLIYEEGDGVDRNFRKAIEYYRLAAENPIPDARARQRLESLESALGQLDGENEPELPQAETAYATAVTECNKLASNGADEFAGSEPVAFETLRQQASQAIDACSLAAESGQALQLYQLGRAHLAAADGAESEARRAEHNAKALASLKAAADQGHYLAAYWYAEYNDGGERGLERDAKLAAAYYEIATDAREPTAGQAFEKLGHIYGLPGYAVEVVTDQSRARLYYEECHNRGRAICAYYLGTYYRYGTGGPKDPARARELVEHYLAQSPSGRMAGLARTILSELAVELDPTDRRCVEGDCKNGFGVWIDDNGDVYEGFFRNGRRHLFGALYHGAGESWYVGNWLNDRRAYFGMFWRGDGVAVLGAFDPENGERVDAFGVSLATGGISEVETRGNINWGGGCVLGNCEHGYGVTAFEEGFFSGFFSHGLPTTWGVMINGGSKDFTRSFAIGSYPFESGAGAALRVYEDQTIFATAGTPFRADDDPSETDGSAEACLFGVCETGFGVKRYRNGVYAGLFLGGRAHLFGHFFNNNGRNQFGLWADGHSSDCRLVITGFNEGVFDLNECASYAQKF